MIAQCTCSDCCNKTESYRLDGGRRLRLFSVFRILFYRTCTSGLNVLSAGRHLTAAPFDTRLLMTDGSVPVHGTWLSCWSWLSVQCYVLVVYTCLCVDVLVLVSTSRCRRLIVDATRCSPSFPDYLVTVELLASVVWRLNDQLWLRRWTARQRLGDSRLPPSAVHAIFAYYIPLCLYFSANECWDDCMSEVRAWHHSVHIRVHCAVIKL